MTDDPRQTELIAELGGQGITDARVLSAMSAIPRDVFVDQPLAYAAWQNTALPIACGQTI
ncbi:MAG TPA: protein-L-isoaspartate O-methyltransferase, partial [Bradyrhizobium sp.]